MRFSSAKHINFVLWDSKQPLIPSSSQFSAWLDAIVSALIGSLIRPSDNE